MSDTCTWGVANLERRLADEVVYTVHWTVSAERTVDEATFTASSYGSIGLGEPDPQAFIPYEDLTLEIVTEWVKEKLGEEQVESIASGLFAQIAEQQAPTNAAGLPWS